MGALEHFLIPGQTLACSSEQGCGAARNFGELELARALVRPWQAVRSRPHRFPRSGGRIGCMPSATRESSDPLEDFCRRRGKQSKACRARAAAATVVQLHAGNNASLPLSKKDSADYFEDFCQRRGQQSKVCRAQRRANKMAKKWEQASQSTPPMQRVGGSSCTWENGCCTQRPRARECRQASSLRPTTAAICARRGPAAPVRHWR